MIVYLVPLIVLMSCVVAYLGDYLGRRLGKKRLTLLGLRPKHTAILITVLTGMLIASATLGAVMLVDRDVRMAILHFAEIQQDLSVARHDASLEQARLNSVRTQRDRAESNVRATASRLADLRTVEQQQEQQAQVTQRNLKDTQLRLSTVTDAVNNMKSVQGRLQAINQGQRRQIQHDSVHLALLEREQSTLKSAENRLRSEIAGRQQRIDSLKSELTKLSSLQQLAADQLQQKNLQLASVEREREKRESEGNALWRYNQQLQVNNDSLQFVNEGLALKNEGLVFKNESLARQNSDLTAQNEKAAKDLAAAKQELDQTRQDVAFNNSMFEHAHHDWLVSALNPTILEPNQLIAEGVIDCSKPRARIREALSRLVNQAESSVKAEGAIPGRDSNRALILLDPSDVMKSDRAVFDDFVGTLDRLHDPVVVRLEATRRFFAGDQVVAQLNVEPYRLIYNQGEVIAATEIDGHAPEREIRNVAATFLKNEVRPKAIQRGMLPDANDQISTDMLDKLLDLGREVHRKDRPVQVEVVAAADTWCSQPLDLVFRVR